MLIDHRVPELMQQELAMVEVLLVELRSDVDLRSRGQCRKSGRPDILPFRSAETVPERSVPVSEPIGLYYESHRGPHPTLADSLGKQDHRNPGMHLLRPPATYKGGKGPVDGDASPEKRGQAALVQFR